MYRNQYYFYKYFDFYVDISIISTYLKSSLLLVLAPVYFFHKILWFYNEEPNLTLVQCSKNK